MPRFRKKPVVIEAWQLVPCIRWDQVPAWLWNASEVGTIVANRDGFRIKTLEGVMTANPGDWIIQGVNGEIYACKPDIFAKTYEPADTPRALVDAMVDAMAGGVGMTVTRVDPADYGAEPGAAVEQSMTVDEMVARGVDREVAEFIYGQRWTDMQITDLLEVEVKRSAFEPIGAAAARVVDKIKPEGSGDAG